MGMHTLFPECLAKHSGTGSCTKGLKIYGRFCAKHKGQYEAGIIDIKGEKLRDFDVPSKKKFTKCLAKNAGTGPCTEHIGGRFCCKHWKQRAKGIIDFNGNKIRNLISRKGENYRKTFYGCIVNDSTCSRYYNGRFCTKHRGQCNKGIIDNNGKKLREIRKQYYLECVAKGAGTGDCSGKRKGRRFCSKHSSQYGTGIIDYDGKKLRGFMFKKPPRKPGSGSPFCVGRNSGTPCSKYKKGERFCRKHRTQYHTLHIIDYDGNQVRKPMTELKCGVPGCSRHGGFKRGLCQYHYVRIIAHNHFEDVHMSITENTMKVEKVGWNTKHKNIVEVL